METRLRELLDKIYELEGLVHLSLKREDALEDFLRLISRKGMEVGEICDNLTSGKGEIKEEDKQPQATSAFDLDEYSIEEGNTEDVIDAVQNEDQNSHDVNDELTDSSPEYEIEDRDDEDREENKGNVIVAQERGKLVFSINERFRYKKELFDNSDLDFNNSLALVASMEDYEEAEDYFLNEEGLDGNNPVVAEFLEVIKRYFK